MIMTNVVIVSGDKCKYTVQVVCMDIDVHRIYMIDFYVGSSYRKNLLKLVVFYCKTEFLASRSTSRCTYQICMGPFERSQTEPIWYVSNERNQTLKSPFGPETGPDCPSGVNPNGPLSVPRPKLGRTHHPPLLHQNSTFVPSYKSTTFLCKS